MSTKIDWNQLVQRESARVEWKENVANPHNVVKTLSAFANDFQQVGGGQVLCGLKEEKTANGDTVATVAGLDEKRFKEVKNKVLDYCNRNVDPPLTPEVREYPVEPGDGPLRRVLVFAVPASPFAHRFKTKKDDVNYYLRIDDRTVAANWLIPQLLERKKVWPPYLDQTHPGAAIHAVDLMALKQFIGNLELPHGVDKYLEPGIRLRGDVQDMVTFPPGRTEPPVPRNFTILLFGLEPHYFFRGAYAVLSVYDGLDRASERSSRYEVFGPIPVLVRNMMERLQFFMGLEIDKRASALDDDQNRQKYSKRAVQEAIVNAFVHRDYHSYDPVRVTVFKDRIEVLSPGGPHRPIAPEKIARGEVYTTWRNPSLAWFMVQLKFAQNEGQGIRTIIRLTRKTAGKPPQFNVDGDWFNVIIPAYLPPGESHTEETENDAVEAFSLSSQLARVRNCLDQLIDALKNVPPKMRGDLEKIEESWNEVTGESPKEKFNNPLNLLRRFLKKIADQECSYYDIVKGNSRAIQTAQELTVLYNQFAGWLPGLPLISDA